MKKIFFVIFLIELIQYKTLFSQNDKYSNVDSVFAYTLTECQAEAEGDKAFQKDFFEPAIIFYSRAISKNNGSLYDYFFRGLSKGQIKNYNGAIQDFNKALNFSPSNKNEWISCKNRCIQIDTFYTTSTTQSVLYKYYDIYTYRGMAKAELKDFRGAIQDYTEALKHNKDDYNLYYLRALSKYQLKDFSAAKSDLNQYLIFSKTNAEVYYLLGLCNLNLDLKDAGCLDLSKAGELGKIDAYNTIKEKCH